MVGDEAVAAVTFERFRDELRRALASPILRHGRADARQQGFRGVRLRAIQRASEAHGHPHQRLTLDGEVGDHIAHERQIDEVALERAAIRRVVNRLGEGLPHQP